MYFLDRDALLPTHLTPLVWLRHWFMFLRCVKKDGYIDSTDLPHRSEYRSDCVLASVCMLCTVYST